ncbi:protein-L-isoaspartate O-methyltransferase [Nitrosococcus halophilus Nc 4]|uniref:Protein-L-isoaspartate O-methyltransferase n=2 Tax=Nitrosococcus halophilus TaxID=133539 RepID=D5BXR3_NITHN|nr:protein-L-isoaspartate(D-aspartate) O-methyltransferase [Nitrosococcus halophilus]ADE14021.1 protein-L-isoaspartate O-methyltransferase [Nitrosococcus halophilus Nc 4]
MKRLLLVLFLCACSPVAEYDYAEERAAMVQAIEEQVRLTSQWIDQPSLNPRVMKAMRTVPRHQFVPEEYRRLAYRNHPLPIGDKQTISQPYIVALMTHLAEPDPEAVVLEVGTGSGYQGAVLAHLAKQVYTIEIIPELGRQAAERLRRLGFDNIEVRIGDGYYGWEEHAPFDAIVVTAAPEQIPPKLIEQLKPGGVLVIPVGRDFQQLMQVRKGLEGEIETRRLIPVKFVPLTGEH